MKKIAIVSSFSESCGNAYFTKVLLDSLCAAGHDARCVELDIRLLQSMEGFLRKKGDQHIETLCEELATFDGVNIQLEAGLYGTFPSDHKMTAPEPELAIANMVEIDAFISGCAQNFGSHFTALSRLRL